jgi:hypothetical protein
LFEYERAKPSKQIVMNTKRKTLCLFTIIASCSVVGSAFGQIMISESWADGDRTNQSLPNSLAWYSSRATGTLTASSADGGSMTQSTDGSSAHVVGFLTNTHGQKIELVVGQSIQLTFEVSFQNLGATGNYFRFGLFDSSQVDPRITVDGNGGGGYAGTRGFMVNVENISENADVNWRRRASINTNGTLIASTNGYYSTVTGATKLAEALVSDVIYTGILTVMRSAEGANIVTGSLSGPNGIVFEMGSWTETTPAVVTSGFDTVAFASSTSNGDSFTLHSMSIGVIPEPSTMALLFGFMAIGAVCTRRVVKS